MFKKKTILLVWILLTSCSQVQPNIINNSNQDEATTLNNPSITPSNQINNVNPTGETGSTADISKDKSSTPIIESPSNPLPQISASGNPNTIGSVKNNTLLSTETITNKQGYTGSYLEVLNNYTLPLVKNYATDIRLIRSSGGADKFGKTINRKLPSSVPDMFGITPYYEWQFYFISLEKNESYTVRVNYQETIITKEKWSSNNFGSNSFSVEDIKLDSTEMYKIFENAVRDKNKISKKIDKPGSSNNAQVYNLPDNRDYSLTLEQKEQNLVWNLYSSDTTDPEFMKLFPGFPSERDPNYSYSSAYESATANINAVTGEIISFSRPTSIYFVSKMGY